MRMNLLVCIMVFLLLLFGILAIIGWIARALRNPAIIKTKPAPDSRRDAHVTYTRNLKP